MRLGASTAATASRKREVAGVGEAPPAEDDRLAGIMAVWRQWRWLRGRAAGRRAVEAGEWRALQSGPNSRPWRSKIAPAQRAACSREGGPKGEAGGVDTPPNEVGEWRHRTTRLSAGGGQLSRSGRARSGGSVGTRELGNAPRVKYYLAVQQRPTGRTTATSP